MNFNCSNNIIGSITDCCSDRVTSIPRLQSVTLTKKQADKLKDKGFVLIQRDKKTIKVYLNNDK